MTATDKHRKLAEAFFRQYVPPDAKWYVENVLIPGLADMVADFARQEQLEEAEWWHETFPPQTMDAMGHRMARERLAALQSTAAAPKDEPFSYVMALKKGGRMKKLFAKILGCKACAKRQSKLDEWSRRSFIGKIVAGAVFVALWPVKALANTFIECNCPPPNEGKTVANNCTPCPANPNNCYCYCGADCALCNWWDECNTENITSFQCCSAYPSFAKLGNGESFIKPNVLHDSFHGLDGKWFIVASLSMIAGEGFRVQWRVTWEDGSMSTVGYQAKRKTGEYEHGQARSLTLSFTRGELSVVKIERS